MSYRFLTKPGILALHHQQISEHGGRSGIRDEGSLDSTLAKPMTLPNYVSNSAVYDLAAAYGYGFIQNHVFVDGNKRVGLAAMAAFLYLNRYEMSSSEVEEVSIVLEVATGSLTQAELADWLRQRIVLTANL